MKEGLESGLERIEISFGLEREVEGLRLVCVILGCGCGVGEAYWVGAGVNAGMCLAGSKCRRSCIGCVKRGLRLV